MWKLELLKYKRTYLAPVFIGIGMFLVIFQSYAGYTIKEIPAKVLFVTGLDLYSNFLLPVMIPVLLIISLQREVENTAFQNLTIKGISSQQIKWSIVKFYWIVMPILFLCHFLIPLIFISLRGESALNVIIDNSLFLLLSILSIIALINISLLIHQSSGNYVLPILTAIVGVVVGRFPLGEITWIVNPYSYLSYLANFKSFTVTHYLVFFLVFSLSFIGIILCKKKIDLSKT
ncbi:ABC transporter permease [Streptococcus suis]|uniref:ABC transporter permease n=1 Tax=Streptococcus suis TaxID=1307 RepID=UPI001ABE6F10|nr:ABC transporter permease [Streptococcus suis]MBO4117273.1 ABC transporter permease [Streptococcus suis]MBO4130040.1 ABC transporter permease [Streptococcus suis]HEM6591415.1 ABC transporter permease [Streptococcus suis]